VTRQLALDLELRPALGREDFLVTESNAAAVALIDQWPNWPTYAAMILGPAGTGKSHLAEVFRLRTQAPHIYMRELATENVPSLLASGALILEDCDQESMDERALFHAFNLAKQNGGHLLLLARNPPSTWGVELPDLLSRLLAVPTISMLLPDDALLRGVLVKHFRDRQIAINESAITYLAQRIPRSLDAVRTIVAEIDSQAMAERAEITRPFIARVLSGFTNPALFPDDD
jgi:chromosomal replication initiation ATPase DnaA